MRDEEKRQLADLVLAPYIQKATALRGLARRVGGNQFRHAMATFAILLDYHYTDSVLLKASVIHDLFEDVPETDEREIRDVDEDGARVVELVKELTCAPDESKTDYLRRLRDHGSEMAQVLKVADRISNLTDLHASVFDEQHMARCLAQTREFIYPIAKRVNPAMAIEIEDLMGRREARR